MTLLWQRLSAWGYACLIVFKALTLLVDMALSGQDGVVQYDIPIDAVEGFTPE